MAVVESRDGEGGGKVTVSVGSLALLMTRRSLKSEEGEEAVSYGMCICWRTADAAPLSSPRRSSRQKYPGKAPGLHSGRTCREGGRPRWQETCRIPCPEGQGRTSAWV